MKKLFLVATVALLLSSFGLPSSNEGLEKQQINAVLDNWHKAAADAQFDAYLDLMTSDAIFIGTDATENWKKLEFEVWAKPFFDRGKAWNFIALERHIYLDKTGKMAWFDELLDTQMKICRGSGVLIKVGNKWRIQHYVLSMTIPNDNVDAVVKIKAPIEEALMKTLKSK